MTVQPNPFRRFIGHRSVRQAPTSAAELYTAPRSAVWPPDNQTPTINRDNVSHWLNHRLHEIRAVDDTVKEHHAAMQELEGKLTRILASLSEKIHIANQTTADLDRAESSLSRRIRELNALLDGQLETLKARFKGLGGNLSSAHEELRRQTQMLEDQTAKITDKALAGAQDQIAKLVEQLQQAAESSGQSIDQQAAQAKQVHAQSIADARDEIAKLIAQLQQATDAGRQAVEQQQAQARNLTEQILAPATRDISELQDRIQRTIDAGTQAVDEQTRACSDLVLEVLAPTQQRFEALRGKWSRRIEQECKSADEQIGKQCDDLRQRTNDLDQRLGDIRQSAEEALGPLENKVGLLVQCVKSALATAEQTLAGQLAKFGQEIGRLQEDARAVIDELQEEISSPGSGTAYWEPAANRAPATVGEIPPDNGAPVDQIEAAQSDSAQDSDEGELAEDAGCPPISQLLAEMKLAAEDDEVEDDPHCDGAPGPPDTDGESLEGESEPPVSAKG